MAFRPTGFRFLNHPVPAAPISKPHDQPTTENTVARDGVPMFRTVQKRPGRVPPRPRERWCPHARRTHYERHLPEPPRLVLATPDACHRGLAN